MRPWQRRSRYWCEECAADRGFISPYAALGHALARIDDNAWRWAGVFYMHDDMLVHTGRLAGALAAAPGALLTAGWDIPPFLVGKGGGPGSGCVHNNITLGCVDADNFGKQVGRQAMAKFENSHGKKWVWFKGQSDFLYVPRKHSQRFSQLMLALAEHNVFLEFALPSLVMNLEVPHHALHLRTAWDDTRSQLYKTAGNCSMEVDLIHPVKVSLIGVSRWQDSAFRFQQC